MVLGGLDITNTNLLDPFVDWLRLGGNRPELDEGSPPDAGHVLKELFGLLAALNNVLALYFASSDEFFEGLELLAAATEVVRKRSSQRRVLLIVEIAPSLEITTCLRSIRRDNDPSVDVLVVLVFLVSCLEVLPRRHTVGTADDPAFTNVRTRIQVLLMQFVERRRGTLVVGWQGLPFGPREVHFAAPREILVHLHLRLQISDVVWVLHPGSNVWWRHVDDARRHLDGRVLVIVDPRRCLQNGWRSAIVVIIVITQV